jgi:hypothetical protein
MVDATGGQQIDTDVKALAQGIGPTDLWLKKIAKAKLDEKPWRTEAARAIAIYEGDDEAISKAGAKHISFNIYHSNIETMVPAVYNSSPIPDIRRRYDDAQQAAPQPAPPPPAMGGQPPQVQPPAMPPQQPQMDIHKLVVDVIERALSYSIDQYDFDGTMRSTVRGALVSGRGVPRVRYEPTVEGDQKSYEEVTCEVVPWDRFIRGPARSWEKVPWVAFEHDMTREELAELAGPEKAEDARLDGENTGKKGDDAQPDAGIYKTVKVYEIWDKKTGAVFFVEDKKDSQPLKLQPDPLQLPGFFPVPRPLQPVVRETSLTPICPYTIYGALVDELDQITKRIAKLVKQLRVRGIYDSELKADIASLSSAEDGTYLPASDATRFAQGGGLEKALAHFPMEPTVLALRELYVQRDQIKQTIYEVTGMADVVRGASDASETATAQQIKANYAGLRIQSLQKEVARVARDLFRMKADIFCRHFSVENLSMMTGLPAHMAEPILRSPEMRAYRIDIETDSTVRGDVTRSLEQINQFIEGTGQFVQSVGALVQTVPPLLQPMMDVYAAFARKFDLGKQAEDALDRMPQLVQQFAAQQAAAPPPEQAKAEADAKAREAEMGMKQEAARMDMEMKAQERAAELQHKQQMAALEMQSRQEAHAADMQMKQEANALAMQERELAVGSKRELADIDRQKAAREAGMVEAPDGSIVDPTVTAIQEMAQAVTMMTATVAEQVEVSKAVLATVADGQGRRKRMAVVRDKDGRIAGLDDISMN